MLKAGFYLAAYKLGAINYEKALAEALATIKGIREETIREWTQAWFAADVVPCAAPGAFPVIAWHRAQGHVLALITSSSPYLAECAVALFGLDAYRATTYSVSDGCLTGEFVSPPCFGEGKVHYAKELAAEQRFDLDASYFYTDSSTDLPLLQRVANPRVVHPDPRLRLAARRNGWQVLDWRQGSSV